MPGLDVSQANNLVCIVDERGCVSGARVALPTPKVQRLARRASSLERIGLGSRPAGALVVRELRTLKLPVVCLDAHQARAAWSVRIHKSDADGLAQILRRGWYQDLEVKSPESHLVRNTRHSPGALVL